MNGESRTKERWKRPEEGWIKINCAAGFGLLNRIAGTGVVQEWWLREQIEDLLLLVQGKQKQWH